MTTSTRTIAAAAFIASTAVIGAAQQPTRDNLSSPTGTSVISGVVVTDDSSGRPLRRAQVRISGGDIRTQPLTLTDDNGRFIFTNLPAGRFSLSAWKPGYVTTYYGARKPGISALGLPIALAEGQKVTNLQVRMLHGAVITGTLRDENGRPMPLTPVGVSGARVVGGRMVTEYADSSGSSQTDDRGVYRIYGLAPGGYVVAASSFAGGNTTQRTTTDDEVRWAERRAQAASQIAAAASPDAAGPPPPQGRPVAYTAVYFPGVVDPQTATIVTLGAGEERGGVDFALRLVPTAKQEGVVIGLDGQPAATAQVRLSGGVGQSSSDITSTMAIEMLMSMSRVNIGGKFSFPALKPGEYTISARASSKTAPPPGAAPAGRGAAPAPPVMDLWAEAPITVDGNDLPDLTLTLQPGMTIAGRVVFDGAIPPPDITKVRVSLQLPPTTGLRLLGTPQATVNADGTFELAGVTPGAYRIDAYTPGFAVDQTTPTWSVRSASLKGQNLTDLPFEVRPNENLAGVTITFTDKTTEVSGTLVDSAGRAAPDYYVMAYPADRQQWFRTARALRTPVRPDSAGKYSIKGLPAGDYYICALPDFEQNALYDPSFLEQLVPASIKLSLVEGEKKTQNMKLAGGGWQPVRVVLALVGAVATLAALPAQEPPPQAAQAPAGVIVGQVVDAGSGKPVPNANVTLGPSLSAGLAPRLPIGAGLPAMPMRALTNADGRFVFRPLSKGTYGVNANASGYMFGSSGQIRPGGPSRQVELDDNAAIETITIRMWKYAAISGTVLDEMAQPAVGVAVRVLQQQMMAGRRRLVQSNSTQTDDRGMYRISSLSPGDYVVVVPFSVTNVPTTTVDGYQQSIGSSSPWDITPELRALGAPFTGGVRIGDQQIQIANGRSGGLKLASAADGRFLSYQTAFYPAGVSMAQSTAITLRSGEERSSADIQLRLVPTFRVTGFARTAFGPAKFVNVRLVPADIGEFSGDAGLEAATTGADEEGRFTFLAVPSGQYPVKVQTTPAVRDWDGTPIDPEPTLWASQPLTVADREPIDLTVLVRQGAGISGRFEFDSTSTPRPPADRVSTLSVIVLPNDRGGGAPFNTTAAMASADGQFATPKYAPGRYALLVNSPGPPWTIRSAAVSGREIPLDAFDLGPDDVKDLVITFADQSTELAGTVKDDGGGASGAAVCVFPADYQAWITNGMSPRQSRIVGVSKSNGFAIRDLTPGDYVVLAVPADLAIDLQDPKWIERLAPIGTRISIKTGEKKRQDLTTSRIR